MQKLMIMTIGTGGGVEHGIARSIIANNPEEIIFLVTEESRAKLDLIQQV